MPTAKRVVKKPVVEKFVPPVAEVVEEVKVAPSVAVTVTEPVLEKKMTPSPAVQPLPAVPESKPTQIKWGLFYAGLLLVVLVIGFSGGLWWGYRQQWGMTSAPPSPTPETIVVTTPEPAVPIIIDRGGIMVDVLNASGVKGKANEIATLVVGLGYKKGTTGNAPAQTGSTVSFSEDVATMAATILSEVEKVIPGITKTETPLKGTSTIRVVLGSQ